jgi:hypothetical protein
MTLRDHEPAIALYRVMMAAKPVEMIEWEFQDESHARV